MVQAGQFVAGSGENREPKLEAGQLVSVEDQLHAWIFEKREQGMALSITHIVWKAQKFLGPEFTAKSFNAKFCATKVG